MACKYVKEFDFGPQKTYVKGYARGGAASCGMAKGGYAKGGYAKGGAAAAKVGRVMGEYKSGELHSGSKAGPVVKNPKQAVAIAMSEARRKK
jgi:hypothetical protein